MQPEKKKKKTLRILRRTTWHQAGPPLHFACATLPAWNFLSPYSLRSLVSYGHQLQRDFSERTSSLPNHGLSCSIFVFPLHSTSHWMTVCRIFIFGVYYPSPPLDSKLQEANLHSLIFLHICNKQRHYFANKGPSSQGSGFSSGHVWM